MRLNSSFRTRVVGALVCVLGLTGLAVVAATGPTVAGAAVSHSAGSVASKRTYFAEGGLDNPAYRPATLELSEDGEILIQPATWSTWTSSVAHGRGILRVDNCKPNCAQGHYSKHHVRIKLFEPRRECAKRFFTQMTLYYTARHVQRRRTTSPVGPALCSS